MSDKVEYPKINGRYIHYKGGEYEVVTMAKHTETGESLVIYKSITWGGGFHARPLEVWNEKLESGEPRFKLKKDGEEDKSSGIGFKNNKENGDS